MSKEGLPAISVVDAQGLSVAVVSATWNEKICDRLHARAVETAQHCGAAVHEIRVVGALELPVVVQACARRYDAVVALGCVIKGDTPHFDYVCDSVTQGLTRTSLDEQTPIGNGVLTVNEESQAVDRAGFAGSVEDKGAESMIAALDTAVKLRKLSQVE